MKKILTVLMVCLMLVSLSVPALAAPGAFVASPSNNAAPVLVETERTDKACTAYVSLYAYADRESLSDDLCAQLEQAYASVAGCQDLGTLNSAIAALAETLSITSAQLAVSDLFVLTVTDCDAHEEHDAIMVTVKPHVLDNYAGVMYFDGSSWSLVERSEVSEDGLQLTFEVKAPGSYAILVHDGSAVLPEPDENGNILLIIAIVAAIAAAGFFIIILLFKKKKEEEEEETEQDESAK